MGDSSKKYYIFDGGNQNFPAVKWVRVTLWLTVYSISVRLDDKTLETHDQSFYLTTEHLSYSPYVISCLTRGLICRVQLLLALARAVILGSESRGTHDHILLSQIPRLVQPGGPDPRIYIPQEQVGPVMAPGTGFPFRRFLRPAGLLWRYLTPPLQ
jgi:hypothetical protein